MSAIETEPGETDEDKFSRLAEQIFIYDDLGFYEDRDQLLGKCPLLFIHLTNLRLMLGLLEWLKFRGLETEYQKFLWRAIYRPEKVKAFFKRYRLSDPLLQRYLGHVEKGMEIYAESALLIAEHSDNPAVIYACLEQLLKREELTLILLILDMIEKANLSNSDAVDLLSKKPVWAMQQLATLNPSPDVDRLIAALLPKLAQTEGIDLADTEALILRAIQYELDPEIKSGYLRVLTSSGNLEGFKHLMEGLQAERAFRR